MELAFHPSSHLVFYALASILIAAMIAFGNQAYRKGYLSRWHLAWLLTGLADILVFLLAGPLIDSGLYPAIAILAGAVLGGSCWGFIAGGFEMALRRPLTLKASRTTLAATTVSGVSLSVLLFWSDWRIFAAADSLVLGLTAGVITLLLVWEHRKHLAPGFLVCSGALALFGLASLLDALQFLEALSFSWISPLVLFSIVLTGCSILLFSVEDDRQAALLAASQIEHVAYYDALTGLANRSLFLDRLISLTGESDRTEKAAVLFIDIDNLKEVNDSFGHATGDKIIRTAAKRIRESIRSSDTAARFAGDEFIVLLRHLQNEFDATRVAENILRNLEAPIPEGDIEIHSGGTIGIALYPEHGDRAEALIRHADAAMYVAKSRGRNRYEVFRRRFLAQTSSKLEIERALREAIDKKNLSVAYQPIVRLSDGSIRGLEALIRWEDELLGTVPPSELIPVAKAARLIAPLGELVLHQVCKDASNLRRDTRQSIFFSINLSAEQFTDPELVARIRRAIDRSNIDPSILQFEIPECVAMADPDRSMRLFERLIDTGANIAIDQFGRGQLSLPALSRFPVDHLKLDRSLLKADRLTKHASAFSAAVAIAGRFGYTVTAQGIETKEHREVAVSEGCELGQGHLLGQPSEIVAIRRLLAPTGGPSIELAGARPEFEPEISVVSNGTQTHSAEPEQREIYSIVVDD
ncbi:MAG: EAL domain-containing protein, partial [Thermoanaerobaculia bacterium]|nr:EAL domain-containing protein [Thermoanaerobaculia bacterium]